MHSAPASSIVCDCERVVRAPRHFNMYKDSSARSSPLQCSRHASLLPEEASTDIVVVLSSVFFSLADRARSSLLLPACEFLRKCCSGHFFFLRFVTLTGIHARFVSPFPSSRLPHPYQSAPTLVFLFLEKRSQRFTILKVMCHYLFLCCVLRSLRNHQGAAMWLRRIS
jgi:hypothetical protein